MYAALRVASGGSRRLDRVSAADPQGRTRAVYAGVWAASPRKVDVRFADGQLFMLINDNPEPLPLTPLSEKLFASANGFAQAGTRSLGRSDLPLAGLGGMCPLRARAGD